MGLGASSRRVVRRARFAEVASTAVLGSAARGHPRTPRPRRQGAIRRRNEDGNRDCSRRSSTSSGDAHGGRTVAVGPDGSAWARTVERRERGTLCSSSRRGYVSLVATRCRAGPRILSSGFSVVLVDRTPYVQRALDSGVVVEQAKGVIAARHDVDVATWFERRRRYARSHLRPLYDVARGVVDGDLQL